MEHTNLDAISTVFVIKHSDFGYVDQVAYVGHHRPNNVLAYEGPLVLATEIMRISREHCALAVFEGPEQYAIQPVVHYTGCFRVLAPIQKTRPSVRSNLMLVCATAHEAEMTNRHGGSANEASDKRLVDATAHQASSKRREEDRRTSP